MQKLRSCAEVLVKDYYFMKDCCKKRLKNGGIITLPQLKYHLPVSPLKDSWLTTKSDLTSAAR